VKYGIHHIFVRGGRPDEIVGIVSSFDVLRAVGLEAAMPMSAPL
jgi:hypothetical protein